jgi:hypothetical protein
VRMQIASGCGALTALAAVCYVIYKRGEDEISKKKVSEGKFVHQTNLPYEPPVRVPVFQSATPAIYLAARGVPEALAIGREYYNQSSGKRLRYDMWAQPLQPNMFVAPAHFFLSIYGSNLVIDVPPMKEGEIYTVKCKGETRDMVYTKSTHHVFQGDKMFVYIASPLSLSLYWYDRIAPVDYVGRGFFEGKEVNIGGWNRSWEGTHDGDSIPGFCGKAVTDQEGRLVGIHQAAASTGNLKFFGRITVSDVNLCRKAEGKSSIPEFDGFGHPIIPVLLNKGWKVGPSSRSTYSW